MSRYFSVYNRQEELRQLEQHIEQLKKMVAYEIGIKADHNKEGLSDLTEHGRKAINHLTSFLLTVKLYEQA